MSKSFYPDLSNVKKILVIKIRNLGDVLLTSPIFSILKERLPNAEIDFYINSEGIELMDGNPTIRNVIGYDRNWKRKFFLYRFWQEAKILFRLRKEKYDLVINLTEGDRGAICAKISNAPIRVGSDPGEKSSKRKIYTHLVKTPPAPRHTVEKNLDALRRIGIFPKPTEKNLFLPLSINAQKELSNELENKGFSSFVLIHPVARWSFKRWPEEKVRELLLSLLSKDEKVVITSGNDEKEKEMIQKITKDISSANLLVFDGTLSLSQFAALISFANILISMDTLAAHMASALKKKLIVLFGPTSEKNWGPWQNENAIVLTKSFPCRPCYMDGCGGSKRSQCLDEIEVEEILSAMERLELSFTKETVPQNNIS